MNNQQNNYNWENVGKAFSAALVLGTITAPILCTIYISNFLHEHRPIDSNDDVISTYTAIEEEHQLKKEFLPGEHIVMVNVDIDENSKTPIQLEAPEGYKFEGLNIDVDSIKALYVNTDSVIAISTGVDINDNPVFTDFGELCYQNEDSFQDTNIFKPGEHIVAMPINKPDKDKNFQVEFHEGYETTDITTYTSDRTKTFDGGFIVYVNTVDVECDNNSQFGIPIEKCKVKTML